MRRSALFWRSFSLLLVLPLVLLVIFLLSVFFILAPIVRGKFIDQQREQTLNLCLLASNVIDIQARAEGKGELSSEAARIKAVDRISSLRYGPDGSGYFWVFDRRGILVAHPIVPALIGKEIEDVDPDYREALAAVKARVLESIAARKSGFATYDWIRSPDSPERFTKTSYMLYYEPWDWVIGTGLDMDVFEAGIDRLLFWILVSGIGLFLASFLFSLWTAYRLTESRIAIRSAKSRIDETESQRRSKEEQFETIFNTSLFGISIVRMEDNVFVRVNEAFRRLTGYADEEIIGRNAIESGILDRNECIALGQRMAPDGKAAGTSGIMTLRTKTGEERTVSVSAVPISSGGAEHAVTIFSDVSELKRLQEQLAQSQKMDTVGQLAGGIAHDFNNMLAGILGSAEVLSLKLEKMPEERTFVDVIMEAAQRAADLTSKLLAFSRRGKIVSTPIDVHDAIRTAIALLERSIDKGISIRTELGAADSSISGDPSLIQNAILNIALNARDAMPEGGALVFSTRNVYLDGDGDGPSQGGLPKGEYVEIDIRDTGTGIPKDILPRIFDPFFTTKPLGKGTGLGLSAVYGTIKEHQGGISVYSEPGEGTEFKILLPLSSERAARDDAPAREPPRGQGRILVVDDEPIVRSSVYGMLSALGYSVTLAEDGETGIRLYREHAGAIDLVIIDMVMPGLSGKETFLRLKREFPGLKAIFSSGFNPAALRGEAQKLGALDFIQKPYRMTELGDIVARRLAGDS